MVSRTSLANLTNAVLLLVLGEGVPAAPAVVVAVLVLEDGGVGSNAGPAGPTSARNSLNNLRFAFEGWNKVKMRVLPLLSTSSASFPGICSTTSLNPERNPCLRAYSAAAVSAAANAPTDVPPMLLKR